MKREEQVLLYQFRDEEKRSMVQSVLKALHIKVRVLPENAHELKIGFLLGMKGFQQAAAKREDFSFPHEMMVFHNIRGKRLDEVLGAMKNAGVPHVKFKAVVTPFNTLWTLGRLCETMRREHAALLGQEEEA